MGLVADSSTNLLQHPALQYMTVNSTAPATSYTGAALAGTVVLR